MKRIITYGTFDLLHHGHINLLKRIKKKDSYLIIGLSTQKFNKEKNKKAKESFRKRKKNLLKTNLVDKIIKEKNWSQKVTDIKKYKIDEFIIGEDWKGKFDFLEPDVKVTYSKRTPNISSTQIRNEIDNKNN